jgi:hypothetical protein
MALFREKLGHLAWAIAPLCWQLSPESRTWLEWKDPQEFLMVGHVNGSCSGMLLHSSLPSAQVVLSRTSVGSAFLAYWILGALYTLDCNVTSIKLAIGESLPMSSNKYRMSLHFLFYHRNVSSLIHIHTIIIVHDCATPAYLSYIACGTGNPQLNLSSPTDPCHVCRSGENVCICVPWRWIASAQPACAQPAFSSPWAIWAAEPLWIYIPKYTAFPGLRWEVLLGLMCALVISMVGYICCDAGLP